MKKLKPQNIIPNQQRKMDIRRELLQHVRQQESSTLSAWLNTHVFRTASIFAAVVFVFGVFMLVSQSITPQSDVSQKYISYVQQRNIQKFTPSEEVLNVKPKERVYLKYRNTSQNIFK